MSGKTRSSLAFDAATVDLDGLLKRLHLANARRNWRTLVERAESERWSAREFLGVLATEEVAQRQQTRVQRAVRQARFPFLKTVDDFDFSLQSSLRLQLLGSYLSPELVSEGRNLILLGKSGRGKDPPCGGHCLPRHPERLQRFLRHCSGADRGIVPRQRRR